MSRYLRGSRSRRGRGGRDGNRQNRGLTEDRVTELIRMTLNEFVSAQAGKASTARADNQPNDTRRKEPASYNRIYQNNPTTGRSSNEDFAKLVRETARFVKVKHASNNWQNIPVAVDRDITRVAESIKPPSPSDELRHQIAQASDSFKSAITAAVQQHLDKVSTAVKADIRSMSHQDLHLVHETVRRQMKRPENKKVRQSTIDDALHDLETTSTDRGRTSCGGGQGSSTPRDQSANDLDELVAAVGPPPPNDTFSLSTPSKRRLEPSPSSMPPRKAATTARQQPPRNTKDLRKALVLAPEYKESWALPASVPETTRVLAITDSNGASWTTADHIFVVALRGGRIRDAARLLQAYRPPPNIKHIITAVGTNNRRDSSETTTSELTQLQTATTGISQTFAFMEVPDHPNATPQEKDGAAYINISARDLFDKTVNMRGISVEPVRMDDRAHYTDETADQVVARLTCSIPAASLNA